MGNNKCMNKILLYPVAYGVCGLQNNKKINVLITKNGKTEIIQTKTKKLNKLINVFLITFAAEVKSAFNNDNDTLIFSIALGKSAIKRVTENIPLITSVRIIAVETIPTNTTETPSKVPLNTLPLIFSFSKIFEINSIVLANGSKTTSNIFLYSSKAFLDSSKKS